MQNFIDRYTDQQITYNFESGPQEISTYKDARNLGVNCMSLIRLYAEEELGIELPDYLDCYELFVDENFTRRLIEGEHINVGDIVWLGTVRSPTTIDQFKPDYADCGNLVNWRDFPVNHAGICTEMKSDPNILHASQKAGRVVRERLSDIQDNPRHSSLFAIDRFVTLDYLP